MFKSVLISPTAYKGTLSALEASKAMEEGVKEVFPDVFCQRMPVADGGDNTLDVLLQAMKGKVIHDQLIGPLGYPKKSYWGVINENTAVIELAKISGLADLEKGERNPLITTTYGVGEAILHALDRGFSKFFIGLGGSATCDGGAGILEALGARFYDSKGVALSRGGGALTELSRVDFTSLDPRLEESQFLIACDVNNPLLGSRGAAQLYAPQKGASPEDVKVLERGLKRFLDVLEIQEGEFLGAAGGAAAAFTKLSNVKFVLGSEAVLEELEFDQALQQTDLVLTGEGAWDGQSAYGKAAYVVAQHAKLANVPVLGVMGQIRTDLLDPFTYLYHCRDEKGAPFQRLKLSTMKALKDIFLQEGECS